MSACGSLCPVKSTRRKATVTISVPLASSANFIAPTDGNFPVPIKSRERNSRSPIFQTSVVCTWADIPTSYSKERSSSNLASRLPSSTKLRHINLVNPQTYWKSRLPLVEKALDRLISAQAQPPLIHRAMRYSLLAGGKRLRPILCLAAARAVGGNEALAIPSACAVECIHTYSLIHDDLPCMDDDNFRRGRPTNHRVFGEAVAVLAGDGLLTEAFASVARTKPNRRYSPADLVTELAHASGSLGLIAGQVLDLDSEKKRIPLKKLVAIHRAKTGALITTSLRLGAMSVGVHPTKLRHLTRFGQALGLAFQVIDDILDITSTKEKLGKSIGKDQSSGKATYPRLLGLAGAKKEADRLTATARAALRPLGSSADPLLAIADTLLRRDH
jgi:geranylgeranyl diphosphate synthase type II